jgi:hypothetical protein
MKNIAINKLAAYSLLLAVFFTALFSCRKDGDGSPDVGPGDMQFLSISPDSGANGATITLKGSGVGDLRSIVFSKENVPAPFNSTLNTDANIIFHVPDTANGGPQEIIFTNSAGKTLRVPFRVLGYPVVNSVSNYNFSTGTELTLTGLNLADVTKVILDGTTDEAQIISKSKKVLVIKMPATAATRAKLKITNSTGTSITIQEFVSIPNNFIIFAEDWGPGAYNAGVQNWSWGSSVYPVSDVSKSGTKSLRVDYVDGGLSAFLGCNWAPDPNNLTFTTFYPDRKFLTFWARAVDSDVNITIVPDNPWYGNAWGAATAGGSITVTVPKNTWGYFKIPANTWTGDFSRMDFKIEGATNKTVIFDDMLWVK